jgi:hypothetical protein
MGKLLLQGLQNIDSAFVQTVRGKGLLNAIVIQHANKDAAWELCLQLKENGLLAKPTHGDKIRFAPPLIITKAQIEEFRAKGLIVDTPPTPDNSVSYMYIRYHRGSGASDDAAIVAGSLKWGGSVSAGVFLADAIDTLEKYVPPDRYAWRSPEALMGLPEGAEPLDVEPTLDPIPVAFGLDHTDGNQHVNSLVYPRVFEELAVRRHGDPKLLARALEMRWRKPFFAGERARLALAIEGEHAVGTFSPDDSDRPSCVIAMTLR